MSRKQSRRQCLRNAAYCVAGIWVGRRLVAGQPSADSPNERLNIAAIGVGGRGAANVNACASENIIALCDVDDRRAAGTYERFPKAKRYKDFRKMLEELDEQIDAVIVSTPDHTHAPAAAMAIRMGKHCYCEKPMTHSVYECRVVTELAKKHGVATQLGTQIHAGENYRQVVELIWAGAIGTVQEVHVWLPSGMGGKKRPTETPPVPDGLDWDLWLGPAPYRPYHPCYVPFGWREWWDFGNGMLGDFGCHYMDLPFWALKLKYPTEVEAEGPPPDPESTPLVLKVTYKFPAREQLPPVTMTWYHGRGNQPELVKEGKVPAWGRAVLFVGSEGMLIADYTRHQLLPEEKFADYKRPEPTIPRSIGHHKEWIQACKTGSPTTCDFSYSGPLTETVLLGSVAYRTGKKLRWDAANLKAIDCPEADKFIRRPYREGWTL